MFSALRSALAIRHKLPRRFVEMPGMSGRKYRYFINNLIGLLPGASYLEIGSWAGSTACAAMYGNQLNALCINNWSEFGGPKEQFLQNTSAACGEGCVFRFIESDFRKVDYASIGRFNVHLFDSPHSEQDQHDGISMVLSALEDRFVLIVDDWNWQRIRVGTFRAIKAAGFGVGCFIDIRSTQDDSTPEVKFERSEWHNGYFVAECLKAKA
jgi:hypothetical protein